MQELAKRAVACKGWRWTPGMRLLDGIVLRVSCTLPRGQVCIFAADGSSWDDEPRDWWLPDLTDPATLGCLLAIVREAWNDRGLHIQGQYCDGAWRWRVQGSWPHGGTFNRLAAEWHASEAAALVAALEAAP